jgi:mannose-1-phosphate guanylyltransferase/phosphomannomutase
MKAMVLCAGYGTRLGTLTKEVPKPMLSLLDAPLLAYLLSHLKSQGFCDIVVNLHFRPEVIRDWFGDGLRWQIRLTYSYEETLLGTAGGVKKMESFFQREEAFLVQYGDVLTDQDFTALLRLHREHNALATLLVHRRARSNSVVALDSSGRIVGFLERPSDEDRRGVDSPWVNSGVCMCSPEIFNYIPANQACDLPRDIFSRLVATGRLYGFPLSGYRCAIDSSVRLEEARMALAQGHCRIPLCHGRSLGSNSEGFSG